MEGLGGWFSQMLFNQPPLPAQMPPQLPPPLPPPQQQTGWGAVQPSQNVETRPPATDWLQAQVPPAPIERFDRPQVPIGKAIPLGAVGIDQDIADLSFGRRWSGGGQMFSKMAEPQDRMRRALVMTTFGDAGVPAPIDPFAELPWYRPDERYER